MPSGRVFLFRSFSLSFLGYSAFPPHPNVNAPNEQQRKIERSARPNDHNKYKCFKCPAAPSAWGAQQLEREFGSEEVFSTQKSRYANGLETWQQRKEENVLRIRPRSFERMLTVAIQSFHVRLFRFFACTCSASLVMASAATIWMYFKRASSASAVTRDHRLFWGLKEIQLIAKIFICTCPNGFMQHWYRCPNGFR